MKMDDSFKKPGSIPFKWEIRPGVPKLHPTQTQPGRPQSEPGSEKQHKRKQKQQPISTPFPETRKLKPPPAGLFFQSPVEPRTPTRTHSNLSSPRSLSDRFGLPGLARPDVVSSAGCFPSPIGKLKKKSGGYTRSVTGPHFHSDLEFSPRWSVSSRKSVSSYPSPRPVSDVEWAGFGLF